MKSLRDQLRAAGLVGEKEARKAAQDQRKERKEQGVKLSDKEAEAAHRREELYQQSLAEQRKRDQEQEAERKAQRSAEDAVHRLEDLLRRHAVSGRGGRRWYFVARDQVIHSMGIGDQQSRELESGVLAIVEHPVAVLRKPIYSVVPRHVAEQVAAHDEGLVRFWNR